MLVSRRAPIWLAGLMMAGLADCRAMAADPIIDMHLHATITPRGKPVEACPGNQPIVYLPVDPVKAPSDAPTVTCPRPILSARTSDELRDGTIAAMREAGVVRGVLFGSREELRSWSKAAPGRFIPAAQPTDATASSYNKLRQWAEAGEIKLFAEVGLQYFGLRADDPRLDDFWSIAEQLDMPVGIHLGESMPLTGAAIRDRYRADLTSPFQLESVLKAHPKLRIYVMHAASPLTDEMIAMLFTYPSLYVDISANDWGMPRAQFRAQLKKLIDAGFSKRIMFGSDQTIFPQAIAIAIETITTSAFLTAEQKRDILYNNAARFLRLTAEQIAADHRPRKGST